MDDQLPPIGEPFKFGDEVLVLGPGDDDRVVAVVTIASPNGRSLVLTCIDDEGRVPFLPVSQLDDGTFMPLSRPDVRLRIERIPNRRH